MQTAIVNGITRRVPNLKPFTHETYWGFKSRSQLWLFMVWEVWYAPDGEVMFAAVKFSSNEWIGF